ncbi:MAG: amino acid adenylation domain-containing protein [Candidatus Manganitrophus sp. SB1]|nr:amino acid adenylation domain-containing protein [Candidatus Manganitrophus morganii]
MATLLQHWLTEQAACQPDSTAVVLGEESLTYGQLEEAANQLSRLLIAAGCRKGDRVLLVMPKSPSAIISILGVLKAGCIYVPIDPTSPASWAAKKVDLCECRMILAAGAVAGLLDEIVHEKKTNGNLSIGWVGNQNIEGAGLKTTFTRQDFQSYSGNPLDDQVRPEDPAYILFTSGSTGVPKGVVITHANVIHFVEWAVRYFGINSADKISGHPPHHFDLSVFDLFGSLAAGASLHLVAPELNFYPNKLAEFILHSGLTQWFSVPSILNYMAKLDVVKQNDFPTLKRVLWCGEVFPTPSLIYWMKRLPHVTFTNLYGPTEATIASSYYTLPACPRSEKVQIPIGTACEGEKLLVLNAKMEPVSPEEVGDLYIGGVGLSPGYWREPEKTEKVFLKNPHSADPSERIYKTGDLARVGKEGLVYFHGRNDLQVKSRGYRIELGEIESALNTLPFLQESAVVALPTDGFEGTILCCTYVPVKGEDVPPLRIRQELSRILPRYMLPSQWTVFNQLPKNANGKIDRRKLKELLEREKTQDHRKETKESVARFS